MPDKKQKLELTWIGKDERPRLEPRILLEDPEKSHHAPVRHTDADRFDNLLIHGDNLLALKALEQDFAGKVKCIYIDPPYNTGSAFEHYDDGIEHSLWLSLMRDRLELLKELLSEDGSLWVSLDDNEQAYFRVMCDEVFGRNSFVTNIIWEKRKTRENRRTFSVKHDYILIYAKKKLIFESFRNDLELNDHILNRYKNPDNDVRGPWQSVAITAQAGHGTSSQFYTIQTPGGKKIDPPKGNCWRFTQKKLNELIADNRIYFGKDGNNVPRQKKFLKENENGGLTPETLWYAEEVGTNDDAKKHINSLFAATDQIFDTPKPEELLKRILHIATNPGDLVLDSFLGSGTTAAVAHKMGRRWIGIELGEHCYTHCLPRLRKVADGEDPGGITKAVGWQGGGGFRFYELGPTLIKIDAWGQPVINPEFNAEMLAQSMCKLLGFVYAPDPDCWWKQGHSTETDFLYVTTRFMTQEMLNALSLEVGEGRTLLVCCSAFRANPAGLSNLTVRKIPKAVLDKCEWDHDDYSLEVKNLPQAPQAEPEPDGEPGGEPGQEDAPFPSSRGARRGRPKKPAPAQGSLL